MKIWKIIFGILSILLGAFLFYESSQVEHSGQFVQRLGVEINAFSLYVGFIVSIIYIAIGICAVIKYKESDKRMDLILLVLAIVAFIFSFMGPKIFEDLYFCSFWAIVCIVTLVISIVKKDRNDKKSDISKSTITILTTCPYCNAQIENGSKFCGECGKELPQGNICANCGATVNEGDLFCEECGINLKDGSYASADYGEKSSKDNMKILLSSLLGIVIGLVILALVGGSWYGYNAYSEYSAAKQARIKFVADSIEQAKKDSIKLAEQKEQERIEAERHEEFKEKFTITNILNLLKNYDNVESAQKCGFSLVYRDFEDGGGEDPDCLEIVYGYDVEKGGKGNYGYEIISKSNYACYFKYNLDTSTSASLHFKDSSDADFFQEQAEKYGLLVYENSMFVPKKKMSSGYHYVDSLDWDGEYAPIYAIGRTESENGWYTVSIGIDF